MARPAGSQNKNKQSLIMLLQAKYPGYQPVVSMADHAHALDKLVDEAIAHNKAAHDDDASELPVLRAGTIVEMRNTASDMHNRVAKYVTPQLKSVEVTGKSTLTVMIKDLSGA